MNRYKRFAEVYDKMKADHHSEMMVDYTLKIILKFKISVTDILDLCCGTGTAVGVFANRGFSVAGLDGSKHMLAVARKKLKKYNVDLYHQLLPRFEIKQTKGSKKIRQYDLVTSYFDSLNYLLTARDLKASFKSVNRHLRKGGWFIFDMNTPAAMKALWDEGKQAEVHKDMAWVWKAEYDAARNGGTCHATFFVKKGRGWDRFDEDHHERGYPNGEIRKLLREAGFIVRGLYRCHTFESPKRDTNRICVVAQKK